MKKANSHSQVSLFFSRLILGIAIGATFLSVSACKHHHNDIQGEWVLKATISQPPPQGFQLSQGGLAASINQPELQYAGWSIAKKRLILKGKRFYDNQLLPISDTLIIVKHSVNDLVLKNDTAQYHYVRL